MTPNVIAYIKKHADKLTGRVIEVGSLDVNGGLRDIVKIDVGIDMREGVGVDKVCSVEEMATVFQPGEFDALVSTETLEHCADWKAFVLNTWRVVKDGGYLVLTMASMNKGYHAYPDYYWRLTEENVKEIYPFVEDFATLGGVSIGWVAKKMEGGLGDLERVTPTVVQSRRHRR